MLNSCRAAGPSRFAERVAPGATFASDPVQVFPKIRPMHIRALHPSDYALLSPVLDEWWGGRSVGGLLPRLFFEHFGSTSCVLEEDGAIKGFLVGFVSQ